MDQQVEEIELDINELKYLFQCAKRDRVKESLNNSLKEFDKRLKIVDFFYEILGTSHYCQASNASFRNV